ncbi:MAG: antitoxin family protein [Chloroflexota bacterium]|nr:antitoxin family protein [Chloroflexota bacterium]
MTINLVATYENGKLRLPHLLDLPDHTRVSVEIKSLSEEQVQPREHILQQLLALTTDLGVDDLAEQHDHYLYGTEKR